VERHGLVNTDHHTRWTTCDPRQRTVHERDRLYGRWIRLGYWLRAVPLPESVYACRTLERDHLVHPQPDYLPFEPALRSVVHQRYGVHRGWP
jgi:hypothetical protein